MKLAAYAKLNLSLRVFERRADGFHNIESVMQSVSLCDYIIITSIKSGIEVTCDDPAVPQGRENLVYKAAELFQNTEHRTPSSEHGLRIQIEKHIPMAAGLAGGSADAAAVLYGLNQMLDSKEQLSIEDLTKLGAQIGSDVPFCLTGGTCLVKGRGELVEKQQPWPKTYFILVKPEFRISARWAYEEFDRLHLVTPPEIKNDLEPVIISKYDEVAVIKQKLLGLGCNEAQMSGSGPTVFGMVRHRAEAEEIYSKIKEEYPGSFLAETVEKGVEMVSETSKSKLQTSK